MTIPIARAHLVPRSHNAKTGDVPTVWIGVTKEEAKASCDAVECELRPWLDLSKVKCYAWNGMVAVGLQSMAKKVAAGGEVPEISEQLAKRASTARIIRVSAIGDPAVMSWGWWYALRRLARKHDLQILAYTAGWRKRPDLAGWAMASCKSLEEVEEAQLLGFRAAVVSTSVKPLDKGLVDLSGKKMIVCPYISMKARGVTPMTCNSCRLCDGSRLGPTIVFPGHK